MSQAVLAERRQVLADVRQYVRCHFYKGYIIGLQWNPGKSDHDKEFGNVTGYMTEPNGKHYTLPLRIYLTADYQQQIDALVVNCKEFIDKTEAVVKAMAKLHFHKWMQ